MDPSAIIPTVMNTVFCNHIIYRLGKLLLCRSEEVKNILSTGAVLNLCHDLMKYWEVP